MSTYARRAFVLLIGVGLTILLWPTLQWLSLVPATLLVIVSWLALQRPSKQRRWSEIALRGSIVGVVAGGIGAWGLVRFTGWGASEGWEDLVAIVFGMMGAVMGGFAGAAVGAIWGLIADYRRPRSDESMPGSMGRSNQDRL